MGLGRAATELETERLHMRQWREDDFEAYAAYYADEETARFVGGQAERGTAWRRMAAIIGHWVLRGYGPWAIDEKATGKFVGSVGLWFPEGWQDLELGYWLLPEMQGKGYATEAGARARDHGFEVVGAETLISYIHPDNEPSKRVAERLGARYEKTLELGTHGPHCVYRYPKPQGR